MSIWLNPMTCDVLNQRGKNSMADFLDIQFTDIGDDFLTASMPVDARTKQPIGILHGGANVVLAETVASTAANAVIDTTLFYCVGLEINANHIRSVKSGLIIATASPLHLGRTTQVWQIFIYNEAGQKTCISRMTASVLNR
ncbi:MAG: hotdog fold thioesterase [Legionella sp.]|nr:hotdog fold thioesterase [Legionella sp.]